MYYSDLPFFDLNPNLSLIFIIIFSVGYLCYEHLDRKKQALHDDKKRQALHDDKIDELIKKNCFDGDEQKMKDFYDRKF